MSDPAWPGTVPTTVAQEGYRRQPQLARAVFKPEYGTPKYRRRGTARMQVLQCTIWLDDDERAAFDTFYQDTLKDGTLAFTWPHPETGDTVRSIFVDEPEIVPNGAEYQANLAIAILP